MGCTASSVKIDAIKRSEQIDMDLKISYHESEKPIQILLLGTGESGKSTIVKQLRCMYGRGYNTGEAATFTPLIKSNIIDGMYTILENNEKLSILFANGTTEKDTNQMYRRSTKMGQEGALMDATLGLILERLWKDAGIQECFQRSREYQLRDNVGYFLDQILRISSINYAPTLEDILHSRTPTVGVSTTKIHYKDKLIHIYDVGGQRSERKKWLKFFFKELHAVMFVASLTDYDKSSPENSEKIDSLRH